MATYKAIQGYTVEKLSSDPSPVPEGKLWYNDTSNVFKVGIPGASAWASGGLMNTGRRNAGASASQTTALTFGGKIEPSGETAFTESYDGSTWTEVGDLNTPRSQLFAGGTATATIAGGGDVPTFSPRYQNATELWNGTSWTTDPATQNTAGNYRGYGGTSTDGIAFGGYAPGDNFTTDAETWNGTAWTETGNLNTGRNQLSGCGASSTSAIAMAGAEFNPSPPPGSKTSALTETWNGTSWTEVGDVNSSKWARSAFGIATAAMVAGGSTGAAITAASESWNGTSWTNTPSMGSTAYVMSQNTGTQALGLVSGGIQALGPGEFVTNTEEWSESPISAKTVTTS